MLMVHGISTTSVSTCGSSDSEPLLIIPDNPTDVVYVECSLSLPVPLD